MRQVPQYLLIGNGRVARHFQHYFSLLKLSYTTWNRSESIEKLHQLASQSTHILLLIKDGAIQSFYEEHLKGYLVIHFSGSLVSEQIIGAHPLMCFSHDLYTLSQYQTIPFVIDQDAPSFDSLLPGLLNIHARLNKNLKAKYHALCVMSGNFSAILWQKLFSTLEQEFNLPPAIAHAYLAQQTANLINNPKTALTGPLVRNDRVTIEKNLLALNSDPFKEIYESFVACYQKIKAEGE